MADLRRVQLSFGRGEVGETVRSRADLSQHAVGLAKCVNQVPTVQAITVRRPGTAYIRDAYDHAKQSLLVPFVYSSGDAYVLEFADNVMRVFRDGGIVLDGGQPFELATPYAADELDGLRWAQTADTVWIVHPDHPPKILKRFGHTNWTISDVSFRNGPLAKRNENGNATVRASATTGAITIDGNATNFSPNLVGRIMRIDLIDYATIPTWVGNTTYNQGDEVEVNGRVYEAATGGQAGTNAPRHSDGQVLSHPNGIVWRYKHSGYGFVRVTSRVSATQLGAVVLTELPKQVTPAGSYTWKFYLPAWQEGYPSAIAFHEQRMWLANSKNAPATVWASQIDDFDNMEAGTEDDQAIVWPLLSESERVNSVHSMVSGGIFFLGTAGEEFVATASGREAPLTPSSLTIKPRTDEGSAPEPALFADGHPLYISGDRRTLHHFVYSFEIDNYVADDLAEFNPEIAGEGFKRVVFQRGRWRVVWCITTDGKLRSLTLRRRQQLYAWARHELTNAFIESIAVIPSTDGREQELWLAIRREINGETKRYIEKMTQLSDFVGREDATGAWFLDSAIEYNGSETSVLSGLDHLEGETVTVFSSGRVLQQGVVSGGQVQLQEPVTHALVGYGYQSELKTLPLRSIQDTSGAGRPVRPARVTVDLLASAGVEVAGSGAQPEPVLNMAAVGPMSSAVPLMTTSKTVGSRGSWNTDGMVSVIQSEPLPMTTLGIATHYSIGEGDR